MAARGARLSTCSTSPTPPATCSTAPPPTGQAPRPFVVTASPSSTQPTGTTGSTGWASGTVSGDWKVSSGSQAGYRVNEVLFGQDHEAVGRTSQVTGQMAIPGTTVTSGI